MRPSWRGKKLDQTRGKGLPIHQRFISERSHLFAPRSLPPSNLQNLQISSKRCHALLGHLHLSRWWSAFFGWQTRKGVYSPSNHGCASYHALRKREPRGKFNHEPGRVGTTRRTSNHLTPITLSHLNFNRPSWHRVLALLLPLLFLLANDYTLIHPCPRNFRTWLYIDKGEIIQEDWSNDSFHLRASSLRRVLYLIEINRSRDERELIDCRV